MPVELPTEDPPPSRRGITCEFCECVLTPAGELRAKLSDRARALRDQEHTIERLREQLATTEAETATARARIAELEAAAAAIPAPTAVQPQDTPRSSSWGFSRR